MGVNISNVHALYPVMCVRESVCVFVCVCVHACLWMYDCATCSCDLSQHGVRSSESQCYCVLTSHITARQYYYGHTHTHTHTAGPGGQYCPIGGERGVMVHFMGTNWHSISSQWPVVNICLNTWTHTHTHTHTDTHFCCDSELYSLCLWTTS